MKFFKFTFFIVFFIIIVGYTINTFRNNNSSPAHIPKIIPEKRYSKNLSQICSNTIEELEIPETSKISADRVSVYTSDNVAIVDFHDTPDFSKDFNFEQLFIYSIVNTLTREKGVITVKFTVNGNEPSSLNGEIDLSETFIPDYNIVP